MKIKTSFVTSTLILIAIIVYLFVTAPVPLSEDTTSGVLLPIKDVLYIANEENRVVRALYTRELVQAGKKIGLKFDENWQDKDVIAGPLPAQFLRETAIHLEKSPIRLGLYLGSDYPINKVNQLKGTQLVMFEKMKHDRKDHFFKVDDDTALYAYMSPDVAVAKACVKCHNDHNESPKQDWKMQDLMGATTWTYPKEKIALDDALVLIKELNKGFEYSYNYFLDEVKQMKNPPTIADKWPRQGRYVPDLKHFMGEVRQQAAGQSLQTLMTLVEETRKLNHTENNHE